MPRRELLTSTQRDELLAFPTDEADLLRYYTFNTHDLAVIRRRQGDHNSRSLSARRECCWAWYGRGFWLSILRSRQSFDRDAPSAFSEIHRIQAPAIVCIAKVIALDTLHGAAQLVKQLEDARFVVWLNPFWGPVALDGKNF